MTKKAEYDNFEDSIESLEGIVKKLEGGNLSLNQSLEEFQKGVKAYKYCNDILNQVEGKVKLIVEKENSDIEIFDFEYKDTE